MIDIHRVFMAKSFTAKMILQVHDELIFEVPEKELSLVTAEVKRCMEEALPLIVPLKVDMGVGANWLEAH